MPVVNAPKSLALIPLEYGTLGFYKFSQNIALVATQAANGTLLSFRWGDATRLCVIQRIRLQAKQTTAATATIFPRFQVFVARGFIASDSAGTALSLAGNAFKKRTSMGTTLVTDIRVSTVAAGLTVGTRTLDLAPMMDMSIQQAITTVPPDFYDCVYDMGAAAGNHPIVLAQNEGIIVRGPTTVYGAAGTTALVVEVSWAELAIYP